MDKQSIKKFAQYARIKLISDMESLITTRLQAESMQGGVMLGSQSFNDSSYMHYTKSLDSLKKEVGKYSDKNKAIKELADHAAYIWFNRMVALRYMEIHKYLPVRSSFFESSDGSEDPAIISNAVIEAEKCGVEKKVIDDLLGRRNYNEIYRLLFIGICNKLSDGYGFMFSKLDDWTTLLFPQNILAGNHIIKDKSNGLLQIEKDSWDEVEIIGWIYQYYISEKKDELFEAAKGKEKKKFGKEELASVTQLFTPKWIVKYMVHNTVGKTWLQNYPNKELENKREFLIKENINTDHLLISDPKKLTVLDPACGSGHILVEAFNVLIDIYKSKGYTESSAAKSIIENNLYGFEIDQRATQLARFAVLMLAKKYDRDIQNKIDITNHIICIEECNTYENIDAVKYPNLKEFIKLRENASAYGSLINIDLKEINEEKIRDEYDKFSKTQGIFSDTTISKNQLEKLLHQSKLMGNVYSCVAMNPPYMGGGKMDNTIKKFLIKNYHDFNADLFSAFIFKTLSSYTEDKGKLGVMSPYVWMFIESYYELRKFIIDNYNIGSLVQLAYDGFSGATVPVCSFVINKINSSEGTYIRLTDFPKAENQPIKVLEAIEKPDSSFRYLANQQNFKKIPGTIIGYWETDKMFKIFEHDSIGKKYKARQGMSTTDNDHYVRWRYEIKFSDISFHGSSSDYKWFLYNKSDKKRRWYGNLNSIVNYEKDGEILLNMVKNKYPKISDPEFIIKNRKYYFKPSITRSLISVDNFMARYVPEGSIFDISSPSLFEVEDMYYMLGFLNTNITRKLLQVINPTMNNNNCDIEKFPYIIDYKYKQTVEKIVEQNINLAKKDWDMFETSWDFKEHPFITYKNLGKLSDIYDKWCNECNDRFNTLKSNEEELNRIFIDIYGLNGEVAPEEKDKDVVVSKANREREAKTFLSYLLGCMMGRYSLDQEGLIYAGEKGEGLDESKYRSYSVDDDGIIPILDNMYFEDDLVERSRSFIKKAFGETYFTENREWLAQSITSSSTKTPNEIIRDYFMNAFMKDHYTLYQKRPIYWIFSSNDKKPGNAAFKAVVYLHRYNKDTISIIRTKYLQKYQLKLEDKKKRLESGERTRQIEKEIQKIENDLLEIAEYDHKLQNFALKEERNINLDDGVKLNYKKMMQAGIVAECDMGKDKDNDND